MAVDMYLMLEGIDGESVDAGHSNEIDVLAWSWGASQSGTMHLGAGGGAGKVAVQDLSVTKYVDTASNNLMMRCFTGEHIPEGILTVRKAGGNPLEYIIIKMKSILVTSVSSGGSGGEDQLTENVTLNFKEFEYSYVPQLADGSGGGAMEFKWDIPGNVTG